MNQWVCMKLLFGGMNVLRPNSLYLPVVDTLSYFRFSSRATGESSFSTYRLMEEGVSEGQPSLMAYRLMEEGVSEGQPSLH